MIEISRRRVVQMLGAGTLGVLAADMLDVASAEADGLGKMRIPKLHVAKTIYHGTSNQVLNRGGFGLWVGSAAPGHVGHSIVFGHRTSAGGPLRRLNALRPGDLVIAGGKTYTVRKSEIISGTDVTRALSYGAGGMRLSIITCTKHDGTPTSTRYRLVVRASV